MTRDPAKYKVRPRPICKEFDDVGLAGGQAILQHRGCRAVESRGDRPCGNGLLVRNDLRGVRQHAVVVQEAQDYVPVEQRRERHSAVAKTVEIEGTAQPREPGGELEGGGLL